MAIRVCGRTQLSIGLRLVATARPSAPELSSRLHAQTNNRPPSSTWLLYLKREPSLGLGSGGPQSHHCARGDRLTSASRATLPYPTTLR